MSSNGIQDNKNEYNKSGSGNNSSSTVGGSSATITTTRYVRSNSRRGRGRGNQNRNYNFGYNRRQSYSQDIAPNRSSSGVGEMIDINDISQWPSIEESSNGTSQKQQASKTSTQQQSRKSDSSILKNEEQTKSGSDVYLSSSSSQPRQQMNMYQMPPPPGQHYNLGMTPREYNRQYSTRPRGGRFIQNRGGFNGNHNKKNNRGGYPSFTPMYPRGDAPPALVGNYINNQVLFQNFGPPQNYSGISSNSGPTMPSTSTDTKYSAIVDPVKQVEYYFSSVNLENDMFMRAQMDKEGWVDLRVIHQFKRISNLNLQFDDFVEKLLVSEKLEINAEHTKVRTIFEPQKWYIPEDKSIAPPSYLSSFGMGQGYDHQQYSTFGFSPIGAPYGHIQPVFVPVTGYHNPRSSRGRYIPTHYGIYPPQPSYAGFNPYDMSVEQQSSSSYFYPAEFVNQYNGGSDQSSSQQYYYNVQTMYDYGVEVGTEMNESSQQSQIVSSVTQENTTTEALSEIVQSPPSTTSEKDVEVLTDKISSITVENNDNNN